MGVKTILVESDTHKLQEWTEYIKEYDRETCKTPGQDLSGLGTPEEARNQTLEQVLDLMGTPPAGTGPRVALIYAHANDLGLIMPLTGGADPADSKHLRGISRAWKAIFEIIQLRSGDWKDPSKPVFHIDLPRAIPLFQRLLRDLKEFQGHGDFDTRLPRIETVTNREQADAWFDKWMDMMAKATIAPGLTQEDLRRVCRAMQKVRDAKYDRVEIRACNIGKQKETLDALKEFFGVSQVTAPKVTMFFGKSGVTSNPQNFAVLMKHLGGFRGNQFTPPDMKAFSMNQIPGGIQVEPELASGRRNRIFSTSAGEVFMQQTEVGGKFSFKFKGRLKAASDAALTQFLQSNYKNGYVFTSGKTGQPVGGMWIPHDPGAVVPYLLPLEARYRDFLETSS